MIAFATTTVSIFRGSAGTDVFGDDVDANTPVKTKIPASLIERTRYVATADKTEPMIVRYVAGRLNNGIDIRDTDRLRDDRTGDWYEIDSISTPASPIMAMDIRLELKRVT